MESWTTERFRHTGYETLRHFSKSIEEAIEMLANTILWVLFLRHLNVATPSLRVRFTDRC